MGLELVFFRVLPTVWHDAPGAIPSPATSSASGRSDQRACPRGGSPRAIATSRASRPPSGVRGDDGRREVLAVDVADTESEATYQELFRQLKSTGLSGVELVISDDHKGLRAAIDRHFQGASWQRRQVHYARGPCGQVAAPRRKELAAGLRGVYDVPDLERAKALAGELADSWMKSRPKIAQNIDEHIEECLAVFAFPPEHRARIRATNGLERLNSEIKRRTAVVRVWPNREACLRMVTALCAEQSDEWVSGNRYLDMEQLRHWEAEKPRRGQELVVLA